MMIERKGVTWYNIYSRTGNGASRGRDNLTVAMPFLLSVHCIFADDRCDFTTHSYIDAHSSHASLSGAVAGMFCDAISKLFKVLRSRKTPPPFPENWGGGI